MRCSSRCWKRLGEFYYFRCPTWTHSRSGPVLAWSFSFWSGTGPPVKFDSAVGFEKLGKSASACRFEAWEIRQRCRILKARGNRTTLSDLGHATALSHVKSASACGFANAQMSTRIDICRPRWNPQPVAGLSGSKCPIDWTFAAPGEIRQRCRF